MWNVISGNEQCDDGNTLLWGKGGRGGGGGNNGDGCSSLCLIEVGYQCTGALVSVCTPICGDGKLMPSEDCDDANATQTLYSPATDKGCIGCVTQPYW
ncbi:MAG: DUF4215 domain-containing protein [Streptococcus sp.]|nr:DUF4215 domain-containing protein [Streptococcus sp.]